MTAHPDREVLEQFLQGGLSPNEVEGLASHLKLCLKCLFLAREGMAETEPELNQNIRRYVLPQVYSQEVRYQSFEALMIQADRRRDVITAEREHASHLLVELERRSLAGRRRAIRSTPRYQLFGLSELLIESSREECFRDKVLAKELAYLAREVSDALDPRIYLPTTVADQRALARAVLGNARRVSSDLHGAERAFQAALPLLKEGNPTSSVPADVWSLLGSLRIDQCRYLEARDVLESALEIYREEGAKGDQGKILMKIANAEGYGGHPELAVAILRHAATFLEEAGEERLMAWAYHNQADWMVEADQGLDALAVYEKNRLLYEEHFAEPSLQLWRRWLQGRIYGALGDLDLARDTLEEVRNTAIELGLTYDVGMVSMDLAIVYLKRGETGQVQDLAEEMTPIFRSNELHGHALAAMYLFRHDARRQKLSEGFLREILSYLKRARNNRYMRFEPSARWG